MSHYCRYTRTAPAGSSVYPASAYLNAGFVSNLVLKYDLLIPQQVQQRLKKIRISEHNRNRLNFYHSYHYYIHGSKSFEIMFSRPFDF